jgi:iron-sulfur cluster repair protein YtfE (RIC family)
MDALELLEQDHAKVKKLFEQAEDADQKEQRAVFTQIKTELEVHTYIEETVFYPAMQRYNELKDMVAESLEEHNKVKTLLKEMEGMSGEDFEDKLEELIDNVEHHAEDEEESKMFPKVRELVSAAELDKLGAQLQAAKGQRKAS